MNEDDFRLAAVEFCRRFDLDEPKGRLGYGQDGYVWELGDQSALKVFARERSFYSELDCYQILERHGVINIRQFNVPQLIAYDTDLLVIQMTIVKAPYILDFAKARCYHPPNYSEEVLADYEAKMREEFGHDFDEVELVIASLQGLGIFYTDARPGNINCAGLKSQDL